MNTYAEQIHAISKEIEPEFGAFSSLVSGMQLYDAEAAKLRALEQERAEYQSVLAEFDQTEYPVNFTERFGRSALGLFVIENSITAIESNLGDIEEATFNSTREFFDTNGPLSKAKVKITSTDETKYKLAEFTKNRYGQYDFLGCIHAQKSGRVDHYDFSPQRGGFIHILGKTALFQAGPLIDRNNGYRPAFTIEKIN
jgi:hypothetical protein